MAERPPTKITDTAALEQPHPNNLGITQLSLPLSLSGIRATTI
jgi:hypothetical protein